MLLQVSHHFEGVQLETMQVSGLEQASLREDKVLLPFDSQWSRTAKIL